ncbi:MAG: hypothetical protein CMJ87_03980 [Planctomycetes bacterium]|nr:hypothetical protein [Planctomycetota bacterium]
MVFDAGGLTMEAGSPLTGVTWQGAAPPRTDYELEVEATRLAGSDFFCGLTFPVNDAHLTLVLGGWGGALTGLSSLNGQDAFENGTASYVNYETKRPYRARVRVDGERVRTYLAGKPLHDIDTGRRRPSLRVEVMASRPLGVASFDTRARISTLRLRRRQPVFSADFASPADLAQMEFSDRSAWEQGAAGKQSWLELKDASDYRPPHRSPHSLALVRNLEVEDFALTVRAQQTGREYGHRDLCLILAWRDAAHFAYVHLASQPDEHAHNLFLVDGAARRRLGEVRSKGVDWGSDLWHDIRLEKEGAGVRVFFDGALALDVVCSEPLPAGRVGLGSFDDTGRFSELRIFADAANEAGKPPAFSAGR